MSEQKITSEKQIPQVSEINLADVFLFFKKYALALALSAVVFGVLGYMLSFLLPVAYKSSSTLIPESGSSANGMGSLSGLARLSGFGRNESGGAIQPELYPAILETVPFSMYLLRQPIVDKNNIAYKSLEEFLKSKDKPEKTDNQGAKVNHSISKDIISLSPLENANSRRALALVNCVYDPKIGIITISSENSDPYVAAQMVEAASKYLIQYVSDYRTQKTVREVEFLGQRVAEAKKREQNAEFSLQSYRDRNRNAFSNLARIAEQRLQAEYLLAQSLYNDIVRKWEESKIKVKEEQPVIKVLEPTNVPLTRSKPSRKIIALAMAAFGAFSLFLYIIFVKEKLHKTLF
jgi:uncharacterized protein involved in exopolysaccharide biosynthesis